MKEFSKKVFSFYLLVFSFYLLVFSLKKFLVFIF